MCSCQPGTTITSPRSHSNVWPSTSVTPSPLHDAEHVVRHHLARRGRLPGLSARSSKARSWPARDRERRRIGRLCRLHSSLPRPAAVCVSPHAKCIGDVSAPRSPSRTRWGAGSKNIGSSSCTNGTSSDIEPIGAGAAVRCHGRASTNSASAPRRPASSKAFARSPP